MSDIYFSCCIGDVVHALSAHGIQLKGEANKRICAIAPLHHAVDENISFIVSPKYLDILEKSDAGCVIISPAILQKTKRPGNYLITDNPYACYAYLTQWWQNRTRVSPENRIHPSAVIHPEAHIAPDAIIGPLCVIERHASVGAGSWLKSRVTLAEGCSVGAGCIIHSGVVIGADGFGFAPENGRWIKIEQLGAVRIGNHVEIGANTCIDRGAIEDTVIEDGVKLDNLIQIAHNVRLGQNVAIAANTGIAGSTVVEEGVTIGGAANIMGHIRLAKGVHVSATTFISRSVLKPGTYSGHFPFDDNASWEKNAATLRHLYSLRERIRTLEKKINQLESTNHEHN